MWKPFKTIRNHYLFPFLWSSSRFTRASLKETREKYIANLPHWSNSVHFLSFPDQIWSNLVNPGSALAGFGPTLVDFGPSLHPFQAQFRPKLVQKLSSDKMSQRLSNTSQNWPKLDRHCCKLDDFGPSVAESGPNLAEMGLGSADVWPMFGQRCPERWCDTDRG